MRSVASFVVATLASVVASSCAADAPPASAPPSSPPPTATASASASATAATPDASASSPAVVATATAAGPTAPAAPWCDEAYDNAPCVFRWQGQCVAKDTKGKRLTDGDFAYANCPAGSAPAFMNKPALCGRRPSEPVVAVRSSNMSNDASCNRIATAWANVLHDDRVCKVDADCTVVTGDGGCQNAAIAKAALARRHELSQAPCGNPGSGACGGSPAARCVSGCCMLQTGGWGATANYPKPALP